MVDALEDNEVSEKAFAYTPGLKVKNCMKVRKTRRLPLLGDITVKKGDQVSYDSVVAKTAVPGDPELVKATDLLGVDASEVRDFILKKEGDRVSKDELLGRFSMLFGLIKREVFAPIDGEIETISELTGQLIVRPAPVPVEIKAYIPGEIVEVMPMEGVVIEANAAFIQGILGIGGESHGKIKILVDSPGDELTADMISPRDKGCILIGGSLITYEAFKKAVSVGASGLVAGGINYSVLTKILGKPIGVAITGEEEIGTTIIITEGFGKMDISRRTFNLLQKFEGNIAAINGATQIRAGVLRPEIIVPHDEIVSHTTGDELVSGIQAGTPVRLIREPYFGSIGVVVGLPVELHKMESGSRVRVMVVELDDGKEVLVPRANVEIIEE